MIDIYLDEEDQGLIGFVCFITCYIYMYAFVLLTCMLLFLTNMAIWNNSSDFWEYCFSKGDQFYSNQDVYKEVTSLEVAKERNHIVIHKSVWMKQNTKSKTQNCLSLN